ncbi:MAG TPA: NmrA/HSCARG family protein [Terriglobia bacterium]|nr:NmrA/HSCARG family protein [Terriglobia bacterium]
MADKKIIAVMGGTGSQGGGLVRAILADPNGGFQARVITHDPNSAKAAELRQQGAEVVVADIDDEESLKKAFAGAYGVYCVTFFWAHFSPEKEQAEAANMARAAKAAGVQHVIWSTLEDTRKLVPLSDNRMPTLQGKYKVPHFDAKGESNHFFTDLGLPVTFLVASFYWDNLYMFGMGPKKGADGKYSITFPMGSKRMSGVAAEDIGKVAYGIFKKGSEYIGKTVGVAGEHLTCGDMAAKLSRGLNIQCAYNAVSPEAYRGFGFPGAEDLGNMFQVYSDFEAEVTGARNIDVARSLNPALQDFDQWLAKNKSKIPLE